MNTETTTQAASLSSNPALVVEKVLLLVVQTAAIYGLTEIRALARKLAAAGTPPAAADLTALRKGIAEAADRTARFEDARRLSVTADAVDALRVEKYAAAANNGAAAVGYDTGEAFLAMYEAA